MKIPYVFRFSHYHLHFRTQVLPQKNPSILSYLDNSVCRNWNFSCNTERGENRETRARVMSIARFCRCLSGRGAQLLTSGYTEILLLSRRKKVDETAKSAIWIPLRGVTIPRGTMSHEATRRNAEHANVASGRCSPPRVPCHSQFSLNIIISRNVLCQFFSRRCRRLDVLLPISPYSPG